MKAEHPTDSSRMPARRSRATVSTKSSTDVGVAIVLFVGCVLVTLAFGLWWFVVSPLMKASERGATRAPERDASTSAGDASAASESSLGDDLSPSATRQDSETESGLLVPSPKDARPVEQAPSLLGQGGAGSDFAANDAEFARYDANITRFDERSELFESELERGLVDEGARVALQAEVSEVMQELPAGTKSRVRCTESVCEVELGGNESLARMMPTIGSWISKYPERAAGDARDSFSPSSAEEGEIAEPTQSMRIILRNPPK